LSVRIGVAIARNGGMLIAASFNPMTKRILDAAVEVHRDVGPGLPESIYVECLELELRDRELTFERQRVVPVFYKGRRLRTRYRVDLVVDATVIVEVKSISEILPVHKAQVITYLRVTNCPVGLLINFNVPRLMDGVRRLINPRYKQSVDPEDQTP
jgi:GxxExxY protein